MIFLVDGVERIALLAVFLVRVLILVFFIRKFIIQSLIRWKCRAVSFVGLVVAIFSSFLFSHPLCLSLCRS